VEVLWQEEIHNKYSSGVSLGRHSPGHDAWQKCGHQGRGRASGASCEFAGVVPVSPRPQRACVPPPGGTRRQTAENTPRQRPQTPHTRYRGHSRMGHGHCDHASCPWSSRELRCLGAHSDISVPCIKGESIQSLHDDRKVVWTYS
jgi:hypothetical protein